MLNENEVKDKEYPGYFRYPNKKYVREIISSLPNDVLFLLAKILKSKGSRNEKKQLYFPI